MIWRYRHTLLLLCTLAFFGTMVARLMISPVVPDIVDEFSISNGAVGLALSGMWVAYALSQFPSGVLGDRFGERVVILVALGGTAAASLLVAVSPSYVAFFVTVVLLGCAAGLHYSAATTLLTRAYDDIGRAIGVHGAGGPIAGLIAPVAAAVIASAYGWRVAVASSVIVALLVFVLFAVSVRPTAPRRPTGSLQNSLDANGIVELLSRPEIAYTIALSVFGAFSWQATASFLPTFLEDGRGLSRPAAGALFSLYFVVHGAAQPLMGIVSDSYSRDLAIGMTMGASALGFCVLVLSGHPGLLVVGVLLVGVGMSWGAPLQSRFVDVLSDAERGTGFGLVRSVYMILGASGSVAVGTAADLVGWSGAFGLLAAVTGFALVVTAANRAFTLGY